MHKILNHLAYSKSPWPIPEIRLQKQSNYPLGLLIPILHQFYNLFRKLNEFIYELIIRTGLGNNFDNGQVIGISYQYQTIWLPITGTGQKNGGPVREDFDFVRFGPIRILNFLLTRSKKSRSRSFQGFLHLIGFLTDLNNLVPENLTEFFVSAVI